MVCSSDEHIEIMESAAEMSIGKKNIINMSSYLFTIVLLIVIFKIFIRQEQLELLVKIRLEAWVLFTLFVLINYSLGGLQYLCMKKQYGISLEKKDIVLLPVVMNLWNYIIPIQGSAVFFTLFLRHKYRVKVADSFSVTIFLYLVTLVFSGIFGLVFSFYYELGFSLFALISILFLLNPLLIVVGYRILRHVPDVRNHFFLAVFKFTERVVGNLTSLWLDYKNTGIIFLLYILRTIVVVFWFMLIAKELGYHEVTFFALLLLSLWRNVSLVLKFTPNNLGIMQIVSGTLFALIHFQPEQGVMISLVASASSLIVAVTVGLAGNFYYFHSWSREGLSHGEID